MDIATPRSAATFDEWDRKEGTPGPMGVTWVPSLEAWNFALYSRRATGVSLLLYTAEDQVTPLIEYRLDVRANKSGRIWHCWMPADRAEGAAYYAWRVEGLYDPNAGYRFDSDKILLDPFAPAVFFPPRYDRQAACRPGPNDGRAPLGVLPRKAPRKLFRNEPDTPRASHDLIVYELHVKGFTMRANSGVSPEKRGTFAGLVDKIPYLKELGVTAVELMPVHQCDPQEGSYWGYMTLNFFSPNRAYAMDQADDGAMEEFRDMVADFHANGIDVWLDVVYNHSSEAGADGPTHSYRGIDNPTWYLLTANRREYRNETGTGNTFRCDHPVVQTLIISSLLYWIQQMNVDGFRFDLASVFTIREDGSRDLDHPPLISEIGFLAARHGVRMIAEAWDIESYLLGRSFPGFNWRQWNGKYRDDIRDFVRGVPGRVGALMQRLYGSDDLFPDNTQDAYRPFQSVNFITAHDGFCLYDLVSYNRKHNEANGHNNTDGMDDNHSWNCGWEGDEGAPAEVIALRRRQVRNLFCLLMLSNGTPMFCAGDEFLTTHKGNNNPYNQDNDLNYLDWSLLETNRDIFRFFRLMIAFRKAHPSIARSLFWRDDIRWFGRNGREVDLSPEGRTLAYCLHGGILEDDDIYVMANSSKDDIPFRIQEGKAPDWSIVADTGMPSPLDITEPGEKRPLASLDYQVKARSVVVLYRQRRGTRS
ncbi:MAG TPA: isoamylase [Bryobacteraceae bacterium]|nr:isoamylase [Bryobacteraceae bacterium]